MSYQVTHEDYARRFEAASAGSAERARIATAARDFYKHQADGKGPHARALVYSRYWAELARRAAFAAKG